MNCPVCQASAPFLWSKQILGKYPANYHRCGDCGYTFIPSPTWLEEAYASALNVYDTGVLERNLRLRAIVSNWMRWGLPAEAKALDYSGGYGVFVRLMRDLGFDFLWQDRYAQNILARGFEHRGEKVDLLTCFEVLEHIEKPREFMRELRSLSPHLILSTELVPENLTPDWWYLGPEHGQHIGFHTPRSLTILAESIGLRVVSHGSWHLLAEKPMPKWAWTLLCRVSKLLGATRAKSTRISATRDSENLLIEFTRQ